MTPMKPTREGKTHKATVGKVSLYITVNRDDAGTIREVFAKADEGHTAEAEGLCIGASLAMRHGCPAETVARHYRHRRYPPHGGPGQPCSISDAIGQVLEKEAREDAGGPVVLAPFGGAATTNPGHAPGRG